MKKTYGTAFRALSVRFLLLFSLSALFHLPRVLRAGEERGLTILQTADIHAHSGKDGPGWLPLGTLIRAELKAAGGKSSCLIIDCGDTIQGTLYGESARGKMAIAAMNSIGHDIWVPGNHDFDYGWKTLCEIGKKFNGDMLAGNLVDADSRTPLYAGWKIYEKAGRRIGVIGMTSPHVNSWIWGKRISGLRFELISKALDRIMPELAERETDLIILAAHHGLYTPGRLDGENMSAISRRYPRIKLILGAHSHRECPGMKLKSGAWYVQAPPHGKGLAAVKVKFSPGKNSAPVFKSRILSAENVKHDKELECDIRAHLKKGAKAHTEEYGTLPLKLVPEDGKENSISRFFCKVLLDACGAELAFHGVLKDGYSMAGRISGLDIFRLTPYENRICVMNLHAHEILSIINEQKKIPAGIRGLDCFSRDPELLVKIANGNLGKRLIKTSFSDYSAAGAGGRFPVLRKITSKLDAAKCDTGIYLRDAVREYIQKKY